MEDKQKSDEIGARLPRWCLLLEKWKREVEVKIKKEEKKKLS
jgi:hypothetical protein